MAASLERQLVDLLQCNILPERSYLAGGTAVYFYLKHRLSVDLDFFTGSRFNAELFLAKRKTGLDFSGLSRLVIEKYELPTRYDYHLRTSFIYFDDAERELDQIIMLDEAGRQRRIAGNEWQGIKVFFEELVQ